MNRTLTSEERLLTLIRQQETAQKRERKSLHKPRGKSSILKNVKKNISFARLFPVINSVLALVLSLSVFYMAYVVLKEDADQPQRFAASEPEPAKKPVQTRTLPAAVQTQPFIVKKNPISEKTVVAEEIKSAKVELPRPEPKKNLNEIINVVGVVTGGIPQAIIEDPKSKQVLFLSEGEDVEGAKLIDVQEKKLIFSYQGELVEINP